MAVSSRPGPRRIRITTITDYAWCYYRGAASICTTIETVPALPLNFKIAGPAAVPAGI